MHWAWACLWMMIKLAATFIRSCNTERSMIEELWAMVAASCGQKNAQSYVWIQSFALPIAQCGLVQQLYMLCICRCRGSCGYSGMDVGAIVRELGPNYKASEATPGACFKCSEDISVTILHLNSHVQRMRVVDLNLRSSIHALMQDKICQLFLLHCDARTLDDGVCFTLS